MKHIVYALSEPAEQIKWEDVRYIGISKNVYQRFGEHLSCREDANPAKNAWVKSLLGQGQMPLLCKIEEVETTNEALTREHYWIRFAMTQGAKLFNLSITPTDEERVELLELQRRRTMQLEMRRRRTIYLSTSDLPDYKLGTDGELNPFDATDTEFLNFVQTLVPLNGENLDHWTWEERREFLNWCLDEQVLTIQDGRLVPVEDEEEKIATALLSHESTEDAHKSTEEV